MGLDMYLYASKELDDSKKRDKTLINYLDTIIDNNIISSQDLYNGHYLASYVLSDQNIADYIQNSRIYGLLGRPISIQLIPQPLSKNLWMITNEVLYWRKANHIHQWMVTNVQNDVDDCQSYPITQCHIEKFIEDATNAIKDDPEKYMPCSSGFFFGSTDYNKWYYDELKKSIKQFKQLLKPSVQNDWKIFYESSW